MASISNTSPKNIRCKTAELLNRNLAAAIDLRRQVGEAQRNMSPECIPIHGLLDRVAEAVECYSDRISERGTALGAAGGTGEAAVERPFLGHEIAAADDEARVAAVTTALAAFGDSARNAIGAAAALGDADTCEVFTELSRGIDYHLWLVESHLSRPRALQGWRLGPALRRLTSFYPASLASACNGM